MSWKPFVVGVDASPEAAGAAAFACRVAEQAGAGCRLVHATRDVLAAFEVPEVAAYRRAIVEQARGRVTAALSGRVPPKTLDEMIVRLGAPAMALKQAVAEVDAEIVVLGGKHHSTLGRWLGGSTSLNVAAELRALSVFEPLPVVPEAPVAYNSSEYYAMSEELLKRDIWSALQTRGVEKMVRYGGAVETILRETAEWRADLLVMGSHGKGWATRVLVGSVTERLLNHLPTSLVVVPVVAAEAVEPLGARLAEAVA
ncbi:MAG: hypothetical protein AUG79_02270 [Gemmatimonadetes bacterium 13_1_20CM_4_69_16]|nr:MAG: hypothetical protein AUG79_02270 [Gemmatimonadetes bacterium 13_1_20CM_4_69_16]